MSDQDAEYEVGYGKPPKSTRFNKGQSGNPKGRPKGAKGFTASVKRELESKVTVREGGREVKLYKGEALAKRLVAKALGGEMVALKMLATLDADLSAQVEMEAEQSAQAAVPDQTDEDVLAHFAVQIRESGFEPGHQSEPDHVGNDEADP